MKIITYSEALDILNEACAVIIDDAVIRPRVYSQKDSYSIAFSCEDFDGLFYEVECFESQNTNVAVSGSSIFFTDKNGDEVQVTILCEQKLE